MSLEVYVAGITPITPEEIIWYKPEKNQLISGGRLSFVNGRKTLIIRNVEIEDEGTYHIFIHQRPPFLTYYLTANSVINLDVNGKHLKSWHTVSNQHANIISNEY